MAVSPPSEEMSWEKPEMPSDLKHSLLEVLSSHNVASKEWIYRQYDHEVQIRTAVKPGDDASVLRIERKQGIISHAAVTPGIPCWTIMEEG